MIQRKLTQTINNRLFKGKAIIIVGARQVGKTSLMRNLMSHHKEPILSLNCDDPEVRAMLSGVNLSNLRLLIGKHKIVIIDEAQRVDGIGLTLKLITDNIPDEPIDDEPDISQISNEALTEMIASLPEGYRVVLNLYVFGQMSHKEIADELGITPSTSASQYYHAKKMLANKIKEYNKRNAI